MQRITTRTTTRFIKETEKEVMVEYLDAGAWAGPAVPGGRSPLVMLHALRGLLNAKQIVNGIIAGLVLAILTALARWLYHAAQHIGARAERMSWLLSLPWWATSLLAFLLVLFVWFAGVIAFNLLARVKHAQGSSAFAHVEITRFETLSYSDPQYRTMPNTSESPVLLVVRNGSAHVALLEIEAGDGHSSKARDWTFTARTKGGVQTPAKILNYGWGPPRDWGSGIDPFSAVDGARLERGSLHRVYVYLGIKPEGVNTDWLSASFTDDAGVRRTVLFDRGSAS